MNKKSRQIMCTVECPYCTKSIDVVKEVEVITPAQKAEKTEIYTAEKSFQTTLPTSKT